MAEEVKTEEELLAIFADNTRGVITPEDMRSLTLTLFNYTPGADGDWADPNPTTIAEAIDRIAAAVAGLLAGEIP